MYITSEIVPLSGKERQRSCLSLLEKAKKGTQESQKLQTQNIVLISKKKESLGPKTLTPGRIYGL